MLDPNEKGYGIYEQDSDGNYIPHSYDDDKDSAEERADLISQLSERDIEIREMSHDDYVDDFRKHNY